MRFRKTLINRCHAERQRSILLPATGLVIALPAWAQQKPVAPGFSPAVKPFTKDQVQGLVRDGLGDESGATLIERRGIDFAPAGEIAVY